MDESKTRIAMIGAGGMANGVHYPSLASFDDVEITAICDLNIDTTERVANQFNIDQKYTDFEKMIQSDLDIVVVSTPMPCMLHNRLLPCRKINMSFQRCQRQQISSSAGNLYNPSRIVRINT